MTLPKVLCILCICYVQFSFSSKLETVHEWKYLNVTPIPPEYGYDGHYRDYMYYLKKNDEKEINYFNMKMAIPTDVDKSKDGRIFIATVAKEDSYVSLATVSDVKTDGGPLLTPYPNYSWFLSHTDCSKIINVRSMTIDKCNRLWALDTGKIGLGMAAKRYCKHKLVVFDLSTDKHLKSYEIPDEKAYENGRGVLVNPVVQVGANCDDVNVYMADSEGGGLVFYDGNQFERLSSKEYKPEQKYINFTISNLTFGLPAGIIPISLNGQSNRLYFAAMASKNFFKIDTSELKNYATTKQAPAVTGIQEGLRTQPTAIGSSVTAVTFIGQIDNSIDCLSETEAIKPENIDTVITDNERLQFIASLKLREVSSSNSAEELWTITNRLQTIIKRKRKLNEISFRVMRGNVNELVKGTKCE